VLVDIVTTQHHPTRKHGIDVALILVQDHRRRPSSAEARLALNLRPFGDPQRDWSNALPGRARSSTSAESDGTTGRRRH
jgi:hypothetical protein